MIRWVGGRIRESGEEREKEIDKESEIEVVNQYTG